MAGSVFEVVEGDCEGEGLGGGGVGWGRWEEEVIGRWGKGLWRLKPWVWGTG